MSTAAEQEPVWSAAVETGVSDILGRGGRLVLGAAAIFALWAALAPLSSAVIAPASIVAKGQNKLLQHRSGGVVREILASEGDSVKAGDAILVLDPLTDRAELTRLRALYAQAMARKARLVAERDHSAEILAGGTITLRGALASQGATDNIITSSFEVNPAVDPQVGQSLNSEQIREFEKGRAAIRSEIDALKERIAGLQQQRIGLADRESIVSGELALLRKQRKALASLVAADHISKQQLWEMEIRVLESEAQLAEIRSQHAALANSIAETQAQSDQVRLADERKTSEQLTEMIATAAELGDQLSAAESNLTETVVRAPVSGTLAHFKVATVGGVVPPGEKFGEIVPEGQVLQAEGRVQQHDIADVHLGKAAKMTVSALNSRIYGPLPATIVYVAADSTRDEKTGEEYFEVRAELDETPPELAKVLTSGMNGQLAIEGPSRTFLGYLMRPIADSFSRAFKEQR